MSDIAEPQPEFSRTIAIDQLGASEMVREISARPAERAALARRFDLTSLDRLDATLRLRRRVGGVVEVTGTFEAELGQPCVVTLEPVLAHLAEEFRVTFAPGLERQSGEITVDTEGEDPPEPLRGNEVDLGELVAQQLGVSLDPYPRSAQAELPAVATGELPEAGGSTSPFAKLEVLKSRR